MVCVGLDVGHSAVKVAWRGSDGEVKNLTFPSVAVPAMPISDREAQERAEGDLVKVGDSEYFIGETALHEVGNLRVAGLHHRWLDMPEFHALVQGAIDKVRRDVGQIDMIETGLPASVYREKQVQLKNIVTSCTDAEVRVFTEPHGVNMCYRIDESGSPIPGAKDKNVGVLAIGRYTTDSMAMIDERWVEEASGSCSGMSRAATLLQKKMNRDGYEIDYTDADNALWQKKIRYYGKEIDVSKVADIAMTMLTSEIFDGTMAKLGDAARKLDVVLLAGGGAGLLEEYLKRYFPQAIVIDEPRMAVAEGFRRHAEGVWKIWKGNK